MKKMIKRVFYSVLVLFYVANGDIGVSILSESETYFNYPLNIDLVVSSDTHASFSLDVDYNDGTSSSHAFAGDPNPPIGYDFSTIASINDANKYSCMSRSAEFLIPSIEFQDNNVLSTVQLYSFTAGFIDIFVCK